MSRGRSSGQRSGGGRNSGSEDKGAEIQLALTLIASLVQVASAALALFGGAAEYFFYHPYTILCAGGLGCLGLCWFPRVNRAATPKNHFTWPRLRLRWALTIVVLIATGAGVVQIYRLSRPTDFKIINPPISLVLIAASDAQTPPAASPAKPTATVRWALVTTSSSLTSNTPGGMLHIFPDEEIRSGLASGDGPARPDPQHQRAILTWLRARIRSAHLPSSYYAYVASDDTNLAKLTLEHSDAVAAMLPTRIEYQRMSPEDQDTVGYWIKYYIGQWRPRIRLTVDNTDSDLPFQVVAVVFDVKDIGKLRSVVSESVPLPETFHELRWQKGEQRFLLASGGQEVAVPSKGTATFDLILSPAPAAPVAPTWRGDVRLETSRGPLAVGTLLLETFNSYHPGPK
jgi:hypothetical protein